jgi:SAM-dependent methyltransferase
MSDYKPGIYGSSIAPFYDKWYPAADEDSIQFLAQLASRGRALELGIGTGRLAIPLKTRGIDIHGIDVSSPMVERLHAKEGGNNIPVTIGDFSELTVDGRFDLVFIVFNSFFCLPTQELQLKCLRKVADHLIGGGRFVIEAFVPDMTRFVGGQSTRTTSINNDEVRIDVSLHDAAKQQIVSQHVILAENGIKMIPVTIRYVWPSELDMMARIAGLKLQNRWEDWKRTPFKATSSRHISLYILDA